MIRKKQCNHFALPAPDNKGKFKATSLVSRGQFPKFFLQKTC